jgi:hypothetical protein
MTLKELKAQVKFTPEDTKQPVKFAAYDKYEGIISSLSEWVESYISCYEGLGDVAERLASIPEKATECTKNSPSEFADLEMFDKSKMIKSVASSVSKIKDKCENIIDDMKQVKNDLQEMNDSFGKLQEEFTSEMIIENGEKCKKSNKLQIKDCYEFINEPIKDATPSKSGPGGAQGCCTVF